MSFWSRISSSLGSAPAKAAESADGTLALAESPGEVASAEASETARLAKERLDYVFRYGIRHGAINPLLYVMTRYRAQEPR